MRQITMLAALAAAALTANAQLTAQPLTQDKAPLADRVSADVRDAKPSGPRKFKCVWTFANARDEDFVRKMAALNVRNVGAGTPEKVALAKKYGMLAYIGAGAASGTHGQIMTAAETNAMHDAIKARNPRIVTGTHLYPVFLPEPLYGYRLKFDVIFETCAWYLKWPDEKIKAYAADCLTRHPADYPRSRRIPFIAVTRGNWCENKTPADVERELNDLLDAGVDEICAFEMTAIVDDPELYAVFLKYCGKD